MGLSPGWLVMYEEQGTYTWREYSPMARSVTALIKALIRENVGPVANVAGFREQEQPLVWARRGYELTHVITWSMGKGLHERRRFDVEWGIAVPGVMSLTYGIDDHTLPPQDTPVVSGASWNLGPQFRGDPLIANVDASDDDRGALEERIRRHTEGMVAFLNDFRTRAEVRAFLLRGDPEYDPRLTNPPSRLRALEVATALAILDRSPDACPLTEMLAEVVRGFGGTAEAYMATLERLREAARPLCPADTPR